VAEAIKVLGQVNPAATTLTTLYTVPAATTTVCSTLVICEKGGAAATFRLSVAVAGAADNAKQYLFYDAALTANETKAVTIGITLGATDVVKVYASTVNVVFNLFGAETS
jgi:hypothetical protein